jgi:hypothetical protein
MAGEEDPEAVEKEGFDLFKFLVEGVLMVSLSPARPAGF